MWRALQHSLRNRPSIFSQKNVLFPLTPSYARSLFIQTEPTPAENSLKFKPGQTILAQGGTVEMSSVREAQTRGSPMAVALLQVPGVQSVFYGPDFITVTKHPEPAWNTLKPHVFRILTDHLTQPGPILDPTTAATAAAALDTAIHADDSEVVAMIKELLASRIRPTIQDDGGDLEYCGFDPQQGIVYLRLKGACRTCESSVITLKRGIQNMLQYFIPEVRSVQQIEDQDFEAFETSLHQEETLETKGSTPNASPSTPTAKK